MRKTVFILLSAVLISGFFFGCDKKGSLSFSVKADKSSCDVRETVNFEMVLPEKHTFVKAEVKVLTEDGEVQEFIEPESGSFSYQFELAGNYIVDVRVLTNKDYGSVEVPVTVAYNYESSWTLSSSGNATGMLGTDGTSQRFQLNQILEDPKVKKIDVFLYRGTKRVAGAKDVQGGFFDYIHKAVNGYGTLDFVVKLYFDGGNVAYIRDKFIILDPDNPVKILVNPSRDDKEYPDQIHVKGTLEISGGKSGTFKNIYLKRTCYYGKEKGVHPLANPVGNPNDPGDKTFYSKEGESFESHTETYEYMKDGVLVPDSLFIFNQDEGTFTFTDPMPYYNENGEIEKTGFTWDYAKFDREAWKYIKRKKRFDLKKAVSVEYVVCANAEIEGAVKDLVESAPAYGVPYLSTVPMANFCLWVKEAAMNRVWHLQVPRYCWKKTMSFLLGERNHKGDLSGKVGYWAKNYGLSGGGRGSLSNYSDWPGIVISMKDDLEISAGLATNVQVKYNAAFNITSTIWRQLDFTMEDIPIRDYVFQWGVWGEGEASGRLVVKRQGMSEEVVDAETIRTFVPLWMASGWKSLPGYSYEAFDWIGAEELEKHAATWTMINFLYLPTRGQPVEWGEWAEHDTEWVCRYAVE